MEGWAMIKYKYSYIIMLLAIMLISVSCGRQKNEEKVNNSEKEQSVSRVFWGEHMTDDSSDLEDCLTKEYDLNELKDFFDGRNFNESYLGTNKKKLRFSEVDSKFPVEVVRTSGYTVYKVSQGGYFYVFWEKRVPLEAALDVKQEDFELIQTTIEPLVYFSSYIPSVKTSTSFDSIQIGVSTARDVEKIDPAFELNFHRSSGRFSYSHLNENMLLEIEYEVEGRLESYEDLVVKNMKIVKKKPNIGAYSCVLFKDLP